MKIAVIGTGYVGLTTAVSLAMRGHEVTSVDIDQNKIEQLQRGILPIYEPDMDLALITLQQQGQLQFTSSLTGGAKDATVFIFCVGTPADETGKADLSYVFQGITELARTIPQGDGTRAIVLKSTCPIGTASRVADLLSNRTDLTVISNPEFLREGSALYDSLYPSRIVIGADSQAGYRFMEEVYAGFSSPKLFTTWNNAEMIKYASNAFLATKISFMNELSRLCDSANADVSVVAEGMGLDSRIGAEFLRAGIGYGGSCFPKDTHALVQTARDHQVELSIVQSVMEVNRTQPSWFLSKLPSLLGPLQGKKIALLGLSFKPNTDDIREAPSLSVIKSLREAGAIISAYDPAAMENMKRVFPDIQFENSAYNAIASADATILLTEWKELVDLDWRRVKQLMKSPVLLDGRNVWPMKSLAQMGFTYIGAGRRTS